MLFDAKFDAIWCYLMLFDAICVNLEDLRNIQNPLSIGDFFDHPSSGMFSAFQAAVSFSWPSSRDNTSADLLPTNDRTANAAHSLNIAVRT